jgi:hypothetical protein
VRVRLDEAGYFVCEIGSIVGRPFTDPAGFAGWSYWLDFVFGSESADLVDLDDGDRVMWVYGDFGSSMVNTGNALELRRVPARSGDGQFVVRVKAHVFDGSVVNATGVTIEGAQSVQELDDGRYRVTVGTGFSILRATNPPDIPSNRPRTCFRQQAADCPAAHGRRIFGSPGDDRIPGTRGWDTIRSLGGDDRVNIGAGGRDRARCGGGRDVVIKEAGDRDDRIAASCEQVIRR